MPRKYVITDTETLWQKFNMLNLCNCCTNDQYDKIFMCNQIYEGFSLSDLCAMIYLVSDKPYNLIMKYLVELNYEYLKSLGD